MAASNRLVSKKLERTIPCFASIIGSMEVFNNGLTGGKIFLSNCLRAAVDNGKRLQIICFLHSRNTTPPKMFSYLVSISPMVPTQVWCVVEVDTLNTDLLLHNWHEQQISKIK